MSPLNLMFEKLNDLDTIDIGAVRTASLQLNKQ